MDEILNKELKKLGIPEVKITIPQLHSKTFSTFHTCFTFPGNNADFEQNLQGENEVA